MTNFRTSMTIVTMIVILSQINGLRLQQRTHYQKVSKANTTTSSNITIVTTNATTSPTNVTSSLSNITKDQTTAVTSPTNSQNKTTESQSITTNATTSPTNTTNNQTNLTTNATTNATTRPSNAKDSKTNATATPTTSPTASVNATTSPTNITNSSSEKTDKQGGKDFQKIGVVGGYSYIPLSNLTSTQNQTVNFVLSSQAQLKESTLIKYQEQIVQGTNTKLTFIKNDEKTNMTTKYTTIVNSIPWKNTQSIINFQKLVQTKNEDGSVLRQEYRRATSNDGDFNEYQQVQIKS